jgi:galactose oxidase-like protein
MVDLIVKTNSVLEVGPGNVMAAKYGLLRMESNSTILCRSDLTLRADRAEFGDNCLIDARGKPGLAGQNRPPATQGPADARAADGIPGGSGGAGRNVTIKAGLSTVGRLTIIANGGTGGVGGAGQAGISSGARDGGNGGAGGAGGSAGLISVIWARSSPGSDEPEDVAPPGHTYSGEGGVGGSGGPGGAGAQGFFILTGKRGADGVMGPKGAAMPVRIRTKIGMAGLLWVQRQNMGPVPRAWHDLAFDPGRARMMLFGGISDNDFFGDTWEWDGRLWCQVADTGPSPRRDHAMAYDFARRRILLFGGVRHDGTLMADTWAWDGAWIQLADTGPSARKQHAMASDLGRGRVVLFGGVTGSGPSDDTWEWDGGTWTQIQDVGPAARAGAKLAYDPDGASILLFGGANDASTWSWDGTHWKQVADMGPASRYGHALSTMSDGVVLFGGQPLPRPPGPAPLPLNDTWAWFEGAWRQVQDIGPTPRHGHAMDFDSKGTIIAFGGELGGSMGGDTWELSARS